MENEPPTFGGTSIWTDFNHFVQNYCVLSMQKLSKRTVAECKVIVYEEFEFKSNFGNLICYQHIGLQFLFRNVEFVFHKNAYGKKQKWMKVRSRNY